MCYLDTGQSIVNISVPAPRAESFLPTPLPETINYGDLGQSLSLRAESFLPTLLLEAVNCGDLHFSITITLFKEFSQVASCPGCYLWRGIEVGVGLVTGAFHVPPSKLCGL